MKSNFKHILPGAFSTQTEFGAVYLLLTFFSPIQVVIYFKDYRKVAMNTTVLNYSFTDGKLQVKWIIYIIYILNIWNELNYIFNILYILYILNVYNWIYYIYWIYSLYILNIYELNICEYIYIHSVKLFMLWILVTLNGCCYIKVVVLWTDKYKVNESIKI